MQRIDVVVYNRSGHRMFKFSFESDGSWDEIMDIAHDISNVITVGGYCVVKGTNSVGKEYEQLVEI